MLKVYRKSDKKRAQREKSFHAVPVEVFDTELFTFRYAIQGKQGILILNVDSIMKYYIKMMEEEVANGTD